MLRERQTQNNYYNHEFSSKFASIAIICYLYYTLLYLELIMLHHAPTAIELKNGTKSKCFQFCKIVKFNNLTTYFFKLVEIYYHHRVSLIRMPGQYFLVSRTLCTE